jgi:hypothetical protein
MDTQPDDTNSSGPRLIVAASEPTFPRRRTEPYLRYALPDEVCGTISPSHATRSGYLAWVAPSGSPVVVCEDCWLVLHEVIERHGHDGAIYGPRPDGRRL